jgi:hypothetical protein
MGYMDHLIKKATEIGSSPKISTRIGVSVSVGPGTC